MYGIRHTHIGGSIRHLACFCPRLYPRTSRRCARPCMSASGWPSRARAAWTSPRTYQSRSVQNWGPVCLNLQAKPEACMGALDLALAGKSRMNLPPGVPVKVRGWSRWAGPALTRASGTLPEPSVTALDLAKSGKYRMDLPPDVPVKVREPSGTAQRAEDGHRARYVAHGSVSQRLRTRNTGFFEAGAACLPRSQGLISS